MAEIEITKNSFTIGSTKYFRGKPEDVVLGAYGEKKDPIGAQAYLAVEDRLSRSLLRDPVRLVTTAQITWDRQRAADVEVNGKLNVFGINAKTSISASYEDARSGKLELVKFGIDEGPLKEVLNSDAATGARRYLASEGRDARFCSEVWVVVTAELSEHFRTSVTRTVSADAGPASLEFTATGGSKGSQTIVLAPKTTFAYLLTKVKEWNKDKTQVLNLEQDRKGMG
jgi:hypothetical protein